jgi:tetratricopeptide (TPR) repeat protein
MNTIANSHGNAQTEGNLYRAIVDLAEVHRNLNRFEDAIDAVKRGLSLRPDDGGLHTSLAWYYSLSGQIPNAIVAGQKAVELAGEQHMPHTNLCRAYNDQAEYFYKEKNINRANEDFRNAIASCKNALKISPDDGETNYYLGRAYFYLDNSQLSRQYYQKAVPKLVEFTEENPNYSDGYYLLGNAYFAINDNQKAIDAYIRCLEISPRFARVRYNLGFVLVQEGEKERAQIQQTLLQDLDPKLAEQLLEVISKM